MKDLLVTITDKNASFGRAPLTAACRGHNNMGVVLNYFVFEASIEAKSKHINKDEVEYVEITRTQETILKGIHGATQSKKTINLYTDKFQEWGFIDADPYHHKYKVYFKNIQAAVDSPPPVDPSKPRGIHAKKDGEDTNDTNGKNAICNHEDEMVKMRFQMVNLASEIVKMSFEIAKLRNGQSCEGASEEASSTIFDPLESIRLLESIKEDSDLSSDEITSSHSSFNSSKQEPSGDTNVHKHLQVSMGSSNTMSSNSHNAATTTDGASPSCDDTDGTHQHQFPVTGHSQQEVTNVPNTPSPATNTQPAPFTNSDIRNNPSIEHADSGSSPHGMEDKQNVEQKSIQDKQLDHIAKVTTENTEGLEEKKDIESLAIREVEQVTLIEVPDNSPVIPSESMPWNAEKMVQITEAKRFVRGKQGARFSDAKQGKNGKSQRDRQKDASRKILALGITEDQYVMAYDDCNTEWWNDNQGSLTVETMLAKTPRKIIRVIELLEKIESKGSSRIISFQDRQPKQPATASTKTVVTAKVDKSISDKNLEDMLSKVAAMQGVM